MTGGDFADFLYGTYNIPYGDMHKFLKAIGFPKAEASYTYKEAYEYCESHKEHIDFYLL